MSGFIVFSKETFYFLRIKDGKFKIDGLTYSVSTNDFGNNLKHHLHGGVRSYDRINWDTQLLDSGDGVVFSILDPHGAEVRVVLEKNIGKTLYLGVSWKCEGQCGLQSGERMSFGHQDHCGD